MRIAGAGWIEQKTCGTVRKNDYGEYASLGELYRSLVDDGVLSESTGKFGRFNLSTQQAFCAAALALYDADFTPSTSLSFEPEPDGSFLRAEDMTGKRLKHVGLIGTDREECTLANQTYFLDYVENGRRMARANLFIYTLPTSSLAEIAIHFKLDGPMFFTEPLANTGCHLFSVANGLLADGEYSHVLTLWAEKDVTVALLLDAEEGDLPETFQTLENPHELVDWIAAQSCGETDE